MRKFLRCRLEYMLHNKILSFIPRFLVYILLRQINKKPLWDKIKNYHKEYYFPPFWVNKKPDAIYFMCFNVIVGLKTRGDLVRYLKRMWGE